MILLKQNFIKKYILYKENFSIYRFILYVSPLLIGLFLLYGQIFLFTDGSPIHATDNETPVNPTFYFWNILYPWNPLSLGSTPLPNAFDFIYGVIAFISFRNVAFSQFLVLSIPPTIGYFGMIMLTRSLKSKTSGCIVAAFFFAFSPAYLAWFPLPYFIGLFSTPWLFYFGIKFFQNFFVEKKQFKLLLFYASSISLVLSIISSIYIHIFPITLVLFSIPLSVFLFFKRHTLNKKNISFLLLFISLILFFFIFGLSRIFEFYSVLNSSIGSSIGTQNLDSVKSLWIDGTFFNIMRLSGGSPGIGQFDLIESQRYTFLIPFFVFYGLIFLIFKSSFQYFSRLSVSLVVSFYFCTLIVILLAVGYRELVFLGHPIVSNALLSGLRRPERILELLSFFYAVGLTFSVSIINTQIIALLKKTSNTTHILKQFKENSKVISLVVIVSFILFQIFFISSLNIDPENKIRSQHFVIQPKDFYKIDDFLYNPTIQSFGYDADYRYSLVPLYQPIIGYLRYNFPNIFYAAGFTSSTIHDFVTLTNQLIVNNDPIASVPLSLGSVKYLAVVPDSFSQEELQPWRLNGINNLSGSNIFGNISGYADFYSKIFNSDENSEKLSTFVNPDALPRIYIPTKLVFANGELIDIFRDLSFLSNTLDFSKYSLIVENENSAAHNFKIHDFSSGVNVFSNISNIVNSSSNLYFSTEKVKIDINKILVWSDEKFVSQQNGEIIIDGVLPDDKDELSIWLRLPKTVISGTPSIQLGMNVGDLDRDNFRFLLTDENNEYLDAEITKNLIDDSGTYDILFTPLSKNPVEKIILLLKNKTSFHVSMSPFVNYKLLDKITSESKIMDVSNSTNLLFSSVINNTNLTLTPQDNSDGSITFAAQKETLNINEDLIIVWSDEYDILLDDEKIIITGTVPPDRKYDEGLSIWIRLPTSTISESSINLQFSTSVKNDDFKWDLISENSSIVPFSIQKSLLDKTDDVFSLELVPTTPDYYWLRVQLFGLPGTQQTLILNDEIIFKSSQNFYSSTQTTSNTTLDFPYLVTNTGKILYPTKFQNDKFIFPITEPINPDNSAFVTLRDEPSSQKWNILSEHSNWISPTEIEVETILRTTSSEITFPIFFGNAYDSSWKIKSISDSGEILNSEHLLGNGFGNLWIQTITDIPDVSNLVIKSTIFWDPLNLLMHQIHGLVGVFSLLLPFLLLSILCFDKFFKKN